MTSSDRDGWIRGDDGLRLYWQAWLPDTDPSAIVVLHHGVAEHSGRYGQVVGSLVASGYGVYAFDARGHGRSDGPRASFDRFGQLVDDLDAVIRQVVRSSHSSCVFLLGYSLGGAVAVEYALDQQSELAGAIVVGCALGRGSGVSRLQFAVASALSAVAPRCPVIRLRATDMTSDWEVARAYQSDPLVHHGRLDARFLGEMSSAIRRLPAEFHRLQLPLLLLHGADDITANPDGSRGLFDGVSSEDKVLKIYDGRRHDLLNERGNEQVMKDITEWLTEHLHA